MLHDWHAEIIAIRAFNHFLLQECFRLTQSPESLSSFVRRREMDELSIENGLQPFAVREALKIHMYCSEAPCGDASMELIMELQDDPSPWPVPLKLESGIRPEALKGRSHFSELGIVRRKPCKFSRVCLRNGITDIAVARPDSPPTLSKSCSDKFALKQCTSLLSSATSVLICPSNAYCESLVLPVSQYSKTACDRAFGVEGRMKPVLGKRWLGGYAFRPFKTVTTTREFPFSRHNTTSKRNPPKGSNIAAVYNPFLQETLINGVLQGRKQSDLRGGSGLCNVQMWKLVFQIAAMMALPLLPKLQSFASNRQAKESELLEARRQVQKAVRQDALKGWIPNEGDVFEIAGDKS